MRFIALFIVFCLIVFSGNAQQPHYVNYNDDNGLEDNEIYDIYQAKDKMIWFAGNSGIYNFNGKQIKEFISPEQQSDALTGIQEDSFGRIWAHDFSNQIFYVKNDSLHRFNSWNPISTGSFPRINIDSLNRLWILVNSKLSCFQLDKDINKTRLIKEFYIDNSFSAFYFNKNFYFTTPNKIISIDINNNLKILRLEGYIDKTNLNDLTSFFHIKGQLYILFRFNKSLYKLENEKFIFVKKFNIDSFLNNCKIIDDNLWIFTRNGTYRYDHNFTSEKVFFPNISISDAIQDNEGSYWFTSLNNGIYYVSNIDVLIYNKQTNNSLADGYSVVKKIYEKIYVGSNTGELYKYKNGKLNLLFKDINNKEFSFISGNNNYIKFGAYNIYSLNIKNNKIEYIGLNPSIKQADSLLPNIDIQAHPDGMYISHKNLINIRKKIPYFLKNIGKSVALNNNNFLEQITFSRCNNFYFNKEKKYLICGTKDNLICIENNNVKVIKNKQKNIYATSITGEKDSVWISTNNYGILLYNKGKIDEQIILNK